MRKKTRLIPLLPLCVALISIALIACQDTGTEPNPEVPLPEELEFLGFEDKIAVSMGFAEPYLYVAAGRDGVWKRDVQRLTDWEYLGLADTSFDHYLYAGAQDIDVLENDILVAYNHSTSNVEPINSVGIWRSVDGGANWFRSDSGIPETLSNPELEYNTIRDIARVPYPDPEIVLAVRGPAVYRSMDSGDSWSLVYGETGMAAITDYVRWNPNKPGQAWFFGVTSVAAPYLRWMSDYGTTLESYVDFVRSLGFPSDGSVTDVAFSSDDHKVVYAATTYGVIKTKDGGNTWQTDAIALPDTAFVLRMAHHPSIWGTLFLAGVRQVLVTENGGKSVRLLAEIECDRCVIISLLYEPALNKLFVGTLQGVYALK